MSHAKTKGWIWVKSDGHGGNLVKTTYIYSEDKK